MTLIELQGLIANIAIESLGHENAHKRINFLIERFGPFRVIDFDEILSILYKNRKGK